MRASALFVVLFAACGGGGAAGWKQAAVVPAGAGSNAISLLVDQDTVLVATSAGIARTTDDGATWTDSSAGLPLASGRPVQVEALIASGAVLLAGTDDGTFSSSDCGASWTRVGAGLPDTVSPYAFWNVDGTTTLVGMNAGTATGGVFRSGDHGATWAASSTGLSASAGASSFAQLGQTVFAAAGGRRARRADDGLSWQSAMTTSNALWLQTHDSKLYVATASTGVFQSADGVTFTAKSQGLPAGDIVSSLLASGGALYAGTDKNGVFKSADGGGSWAPLSEGFPTPAPRVVAFAVHGKKLIAATELGGVWTRDL